MLNPLTGYIWALLLQLVLRDEYKILTTLSVSIGVFIIYALFFTGSRLVDVEGEETGSSSDTDSG